MCASTTRYALAILLIVCVMQAGGAFAQNTSSVSSPTADAGERKLEYRFGWVPAEGAAEASFAHRFDYGFALNDRQAAKLVLVANDRPGRDRRISHVMGEYLFELTPESARTWQSGVRFDARLSNGDAPEQIGVDWINRWQLDERLSARAMLVTSMEIGERAADSIALEARSSLTYSLDGGYNLALLSFNDLGTLDAFGPGSQAHQAGVTVSGPLGQGWRWTAGNLFGVSDPAPDNDIRFWLSRDF